MAGIRDEGTLESAVLAPRQRHHYETAGLLLCAAYAFHLATAHAFIDGNKRVAAAATAAFLGLNGTHLIATDDELYDFYVSIAAGEMTRDEVEERRRSRVAFR